MNGTGDQAFEPSYLQLHRRGELRRCIDRATAALAECRLCPRDCRVDREHGATGYCSTARHARVVGFGPHFGEELCLSGIRGSGTIFFNRCNLACVFCQNFDTSQHNAGITARPDDLAAIMLELQNLGCHNINLVTPSHVTAHILEALPIAIDKGLRLPLVYNSGGYDATVALELLDGVIDIYMPDIKFFNETKTKRYLDAPAYPAVVRRVLRLMHKQVGDLVCDDDGIAQRGLIVRHLVMPDGLDDARAIMKFLAEELSTDSYVNLMDQYRPANRVIQGLFEELGRPIRQEEWQTVRDHAREVGLHRLDP